MSSVITEANMLVGNDTISLSEADDDGVFGRHAFLQEKPHIVIPTIIIVSIASVSGTFGNILILMAVATFKKLRNIESIFIVNLAISDMFVTAITDPMNIVDYRKEIGAGAKHSADTKSQIRGEEFFNTIPGLCQTMGSLCTISCIGSLMSIGSLSFNRYIYICHQKWYTKVFTKRNCICLCVSFYIFGMCLVLVNVAGLGDHQFDRKAILCIWDRMATHKFTIFFSVVLVWVPMILIGVCYSLIYRFVSNHRKNISSSSQRNVKTQLAKTLFIIYAVFSVSWIPYALAIAVDYDDSFSHEAHSYIATFAHLHPSINWIVYYTTNKNFRTAFNSILCVCRDTTKQKTVDAKVSATVSQGESSNTTDTKL